MSSSNTVEFAKSDEQLIAEPSKKKKYLIVGGVSLLAVVVIVSIVLAVVLINNDEDIDSRDPVSLDDILNGNLYARRFNGTWIDGNSFHYFDDSRNFVVFDVAQNKAETFIEAVNGQRFFSANRYKVSPDKKFILMASSMSGGFRYSFTALWHVYDVEAKRAIPLTLGGLEGLYFSLVQFSPVDSSMIIVFENNIYYKRTPTATEVQITTDGTTDSIFNGVPDWVYEEEITLSNSASWFSTDGSKLAFIRFDDTKVPVISIPRYGRAGDLDYQYPQTLEIHYPKVGAKNPEVKLFYVHLATVQTQVTLHEVPVPARHLNADLDHIIMSVSWANPNDLIAVFTNRIQNRGGITKCTTGTTLVCEEVLSLDMPNGWIEFFSAPFYNKAGNMMTFIWSNEGYRHVVSLDLNAKQLKMRSSGKFVVTGIIGYNYEKDVILFTANVEGESKVQHIYAIKNEDGAEKVCLSCTPASGYTFFSASVSADGSILATVASGPEVPQVHIYTLKVETDITLTNHIEYVSNGALVETLKDKKLPRIVYDKIVLENGSESQVKLMLPANLDEKKKYPMLVDVYGGPDSSSVTDRWSIHWGTYLASAHDIIYVEIDGRGAGLRGDSNLFALYLKLGTVEIEDQIETTAKLQKKYPYIDENRSAIWGWSYGGFVAGMAITKDTENVFKCAVSVAPVTDYRFYDSMYTERYMHLPATNDLGYNNTRIMNYVDNIKTNDKSYMIIHGNYDDNVHFQQSMVLARTLELKDIQFEEISYPDEDHNLGGVSPHLYHSLERFLMKCFE